MMCRLWMKRCYMEELYRFSFVPKTRRHCTCIVFPLKCHAWAICERPFPVMGVGRGAKGACPTGFSNLIWCYEFRGRKIFSLSFGIGTMKFHHYWSSYKNPFGHHPWRKSFRRLCLQLGYVVVNTATFAVNTPLMADFLTSSSRVNFRQINFEHCPTVSHHAESQINSQCKDLHPGNRNCDIFLHIRHFCEWKRKWHAGIEQTSSQEIDVVIDVQWSQLWSSLTFWLSWMSVPWLALCIFQKLILFRIQNDALFALNIFFWNWLRMIKPLITERSF